MNRFSNIASATVMMMGMASFAIAGDTKTDPKAAAAKTAEPGKPAMAQPKPPTEIADMIKSLGGTWKCDGTATGMDGKETKFTGKLTSKSELDGFWVHDSFEGMMGAGKFRFESYTTYDAGSKKWHVMMADNWGGMMNGTSDGMKDMKMETVSDTLGPMGKGQFKDHLDASDMKKGVHMWGEDSMDGRTWNKVYDMVCKK
jgi:hypothetical protein